VVVKVSDICSETTKGLDKADIEVVEEVVTTTNEGRVLLLLELDDDVTGDGVGGLIGSALENVGRSGDTALGNVNLDSLLLLDSLVTVTLAALGSGRDDVTLTLTLRAGNLLLGNHTRTDLANHDLDTLALTATTDGDGGATFALAASADGVTSKTKLLSAASVDLFKGESEREDNVLTFLLRRRTTTAATTTEEIENIHVITTTTTTVLKGFLTALIIERTLVRVGKNLISMLDVLELISITTFIRVMNHSLTTIRLLDLSFRSFLGNIKELV
jgi:hypothetical protein